jgi:succinate dehydrogenase / fumarate reductase flavoprotein subunit
LDLNTLLAVSEAITRAALARKESRGGHTRDDFPDTDPEFGKVNVVVRQRGDELIVSTEPIPKMPDELEKLLEG